MRGSSIRLSLTLLTFLFTPKAFAAWVLPPHAASAVKVAVKVASKADKDGLVRSAALNKDTISVKAENSAGETVLAVTLVHPSVAPEGSFLGAGVALLTSPGPLDASALAGLKASLKAAKRAVPWVETPDEARWMRAPPRAPRPS